MKIQILFLIIFLFVMFSLVEKKDTEIEQITSIIQDVSEDDERSRSIQIVQEKLSWKDIFFQIVAIVLLVFCLLLVYFSLTKFYEPIFINPYSNKTLEQLFNKLGLSINNNHLIGNNSIYQDDFYIDPKNDPDNFFRALKKMLGPIEIEALQHQINNNANEILNEQDKNIVIQSLINHQIVLRPLRIFYQKRLFGKRYKEPVYSNMYEDKGFEVWLPDYMFDDDQNVKIYIDNKNLVNELIKISPESLLLKNSKDFYNQKSNDNHRLNSLPETLRENHTVDDFFSAHIDDIYDPWLKTIIPKNEIKNTENLIQYTFTTPDDNIQLLLWAEVDDNNRILNFQSEELDGEIRPDYYSFDQNVLFEFDVNKREITKKKNVIYINHYIEVPEEDFINLYYDNDIYTSINKN